VDFKIAVIAVGFARQQAFQLAAGRLGAQLFECALGLRDDIRVTLGLAQFDQFQRLVDLALDPPVAGYRMVEPGSFAQQLLRGRRVVPQTWVLDLVVQLGEAPGCRIPVKDASSAVPATF